ncbi:hypothetical protein TNCV_4350771 [Trichonephila clavipes]|nr:hypothetical protein TNCV_4350771 [Trichonephila clavipes]
MSTRLAWELNTGVARQTDNLIGASVDAPQRPKSQFRVLRRILGLTVITINEILIKDINPLFVFRIPELSSHFQEKGVVEEESS